MNQIEKELYDTALRNVVIELRRVSGNNGFHMSKNKCENDRLRMEFGERIRLFAESHLRHVSDAPFMKGTAMVLMYPRRREPRESRMKPLRVRRINELALMWTCVFLRFSFRGITERGTLNFLKAEVLWYLERCGYHKPRRKLLCPDVYIPESEKGLGQGYAIASRPIFCPDLSLWENEKHWRFMRSNDVDEMIKEPWHTIPVPRSKTCEECIREYQAAD